jgi:hypothetical protein
MVLAAILWLITLLLVVSLPSATSFDNLLLGNLISAPHGYLLTEVGHSLSTPTLLSITAFSLPQSVFGSPSVLPNMETPSECLAAARRNLQLEAQLLDLKKANNVWQKEYSLLKEKCDAFEDRSLLYYSDFLDALAKVNKYRTAAKATEARAKALETQLDEKDCFISLLTDLQPHDLTLRETTLRSRTRLHTNEKIVATGRKRNPSVKINTAVTDLTALKGPEKTMDGKKVKQKRRLLAFRKDIMAKQGPLFSHAESAPDEDEERRSLVDEFLTLAHNGDLSMAERSTQGVTTKTSRVLGPQYADVLHTSPNTLPTVPSLSSIEACLPGTQTSPSADKRSKVKARTSSIRPSASQSLHQNLATVSTKGRHIKPGASSSKKGGRIPLADVDTNKLKPRYMTTMKYQGSSKATEMSGSITSIHVRGPVVPFCIGPDEFDPDFRSFFKTQGPGKSAHFPRFRRPVHRRYTPQWSDADAPYSLSSLLRSPEPCCHQVCFRETWSEVHLCLR